MKRALARRCLVWPVFVARDTAAALSLPFAVSVAYRDTETDGDHWLVTASQTEPLPSIPRDRWSHRLPGRHSLALAIAAAFDTWRAAHGRLPERIRDAHRRDLRVTIDARPAEIALSALGYPDWVDELLDKPQRSLEAYMAQAILGRMLDRRHGARTMATGSLLPIEGNQFGWQVAWPKPAMSATVRALAATRPRPPTPAARVPTSGLSSRRATLASAVRSTSELAPTSSPSIP